MSGTEWFLLIVVVILVPLVIAVAVTLWTLEMARQRNRRNRPGTQGKQVGVARKATRAASGESDNGAVASDSAPGEESPPLRQEPSAANDEDRSPSAG